MKKVRLWFTSRAALVRQTDDAFKALTRERRRHEATHAAMAVLSSDAEVWRQLAAKSGCTGLVEHAALAHRLHVAEARLA
jgi:hypothetical protein